MQLPWHGHPLRMDPDVVPWADLVAKGWANACGEAISHANLAIRGRLLSQIIDEQLEADSSRISHRWAPHSLVGD